jgi:methyl-accepting chemotaxis protein
MFAPMVSLFMKMKFSVKFILIGSFFFIAIGVVSFKYASLQQEQIDFVQLEIDGAEIVAHTTPLFQALLNARQSVSSNNEVDQAIVRIDEMDKLHGASIGTTDDWLNWKNKWYQDREFAQTDAMRNGQFDERIEQAKTYLIAVADGSKLTLDPELDTYYLMNLVTNVQVASIVEVGQLRFLGEEIQQLSGFSPAMLERVIAQMQAVQITHQSTQASMETVMKTDPLLDQKIRSNYELLEEQFQSMWNDWELFLKSNAPGSLREPESLNAARAAVMIAQDDYLMTQFRLHQSLGIELDERLIKREEQLQSSMNMLILILSITFLVILYLFISFYISIRQGAEQVIEAMTRIGGGDLRPLKRTEMKDELGDLYQSLHEMNRNLRDVIEHVVHSADQVDGGSREISKGNIDLAQRTEEQSAQLEEVANRVSIIANSILSSTQKSDQSEQVSGKNLEVVKSGYRVIQQLQQTMQEINQSNQLISDMITKVNDIAFQTNLLALNAAVEAARAGDSGRGFAVVAQEVRSLAGRSTEFATEIAQSARKNMITVQKGNESMEETIHTFERIVENTEEAVHFIGEIARQLRDQAQSTNAIQKSIHELSDVTHQNAAFVEQISSLSEELSQQANTMNQSTRHFKL